MKIYENHQESMKIDENHTSRVPRFRKKSKICPKINSLHFSILAKNITSQKYGQIVPTPCGSISHHTKPSQKPYNAQNPVFRKSILGARRQRRQPLNKVTIWRTRRSRSKRRKGSKKEAGEQEAGRKRQEGGVRREEELGGSRAEEGGRGKLGENGVGGGKRKGKGGGMRQEGVVQFYFLEESTFHNVSN